MAVVYGRVKMTLTRASGIEIDLATPLDTAVLFLQTRALDLGDPQFSKFIDLLVLDLNNRDRIENLYLTWEYAFTLDADEDTDETAGWQVWGTWPLDDLDGNFLFDSDGPPPSAPYHRFRIDDLGVQSRWTLSRIILYGEPDGEAF